MIRGRRRRATSAGSPSGVRPPGATASSARPARTSRPGGQTVHVAFIGLGLIGGSVARALREAGGWTAAAWSPSGAGPARALRSGVIDAAPATLELALADADLVVLAAPPTACLELLDRLAGPSRAALPGSAVVTDVASTKALMLARAATRRAPLRRRPSHGRPRDERLRGRGGRPVRGTTVGRRPGGPVRQHRDRAGRADWPAPPARPRCEWRPARTTRPWR